MACTRGSRPAYWGRWIIFCYNRFQVIDGCIVGQEKCVGQSKAGKGPNVDLPGPDHSLNFTRFTETPLEYRDARQM